MPDYKENPQLALEALKELTDEFAGGVSALQLGLTAPLLQPDQNEIHNFVRNHIASKVKQHLDDFWSYDEVEDKLKKMKELENNALPTAAWRPKTGVVNASAIEAACLLAKKKHLELKICSMKKKSAVLQHKISDFKVLTSQQMNDISNISLSSIATKKPDQISL